MATTSTTIRVGKKSPVKVPATHRKKKTTSAEDNALREAKALQQFKDVMLKYAGKASFEGYVD